MHSTLKLVMGEAFRGGGVLAVALSVISETACHQVGKEQMSLSHFG